MYNAVLISSSSCIFSTLSTRFCGVVLGKYFSSTVIFWIPHAHVHAHMVIFTHPKNTFIENALICSKAFSQTHKARSGPHTCDLSTEWLEWTSGWERPEVHSPPCSDLTRALSVPSGAHVNWRKRRRQQQRHQPEDLPRPRGTLKEIHKGTIANAHCTFFATVRKVLWISAMEGR